MSVYALMGLLFSVSAGRLLDARGPVLLVVACMLLALGCSITLVAPESGLAVLIGRGCEGLGYTVLAIAGPTCAQRSAAPSQMALVAGLSAGWVPLGQLGANGLAYPFADAGAWRPVWWWAVAATLAILAWVAIQARRVPLGPGGGSTTVPEGRERRLLILASGVFLLWSGQYIGFMTWLNQYVVAELGQDPGVAVAAASLAAFFVLVLNIGTGFGLRHGLPLAPLFVGSIAVEVAIWLLAPHASGTSGLVLLGLYGVACGVTPVCLFAMPPLIMGAGRVSGASYGLLMRGRNVGVLAGPVLLPFLIGHLGWDTALPIYAGVTALAGAGAFVLARSLARLA
jgi:MFS family permease